MFSPGFKMVSPSSLMAVTLHGNDQIKSILVANKCDQEVKRQVSREEAIAFANQHGLLYIEASAKSGKNVEEVLGPPNTRCFSFWPKIFFRV